MTKKHVSLCLALREREGEKKRERERERERERGEGGGGGRREGGRVFLIIHIVIALTNRWYVDTDKRKQSKKEDCERE